MPGKNSNLPGSNRPRGVEGGGKKRRRERRREKEVAWRVAEKEEKGHGGEPGELSFEVAAGSFTFRNEIVSFLSRTIDPLPPFFLAL